MTTRFPQWTPQNQFDLDELNARRSQWLAGALPPLQAVVGTLPIALGIPKDSINHSRIQKTLTDWMMSNARALRDALKPFDAVRAVTAEPDINHE